jgi:hypothetical protein
MSETTYSLSYRVSRAVITVVFNIVLWILIPTLLYGQLERGLPASPIVISSDFIYAFGVTITALQAIGALTTGMALSVPFVSGSYVAEAYYIWAAANGGLLAFSAAGMAITLSFQTVLFLLMLAPLFNAVKAPISYLLDQSEASRPSPDAI